MSSGMIVLLRKDQNKGDKVDYFKPITLLNANYRILVMVLVKRLALVVGNLMEVGSAYIRYPKKNYLQPPPYSLHR